MRAFLSLCLVLLTMGPISRANLIEDAIDLYGAWGSWGMSLRLREMSEAELEAELDRRLAAKLLEITSATNRARAEILKNNIASQLKSIDSKKQILGQTKQSVELITALYSGFDNYIKNKAEVINQIEALVQNLDLQIENLTLATELMTLIKSDLQSPAEDETKKVPYLASQTDLFAKQLGLTKDQFILLSVHYSNQEELTAQFADIGFVVRQLEVLTIALETQISTIEMRMAVNEEALQGLK